MENQNGDGSPGENELDRRRAPRRLPTGELDDENRGPDRRTHKPGVVGLLRDMFGIKPRNTTAP